MGAITFRSCCRSTARRLPWCAPLLTTPSPLFLQAGGISGLGGVLGGGMSGFGGMGGLGGLGGMAGLGGVGQKNAAGTDGGLQHLLEAAQRYQVEDTSNGNGRDRDDGAARAAKRFCAEPAARAEEARA